MTVKHTKHGAEKNEIRTPDGGWGYAVAAALTIVFVAAFSHMHSMGLLYGDFFIRTGYGVQGYTILMGVMNITYSLSGLITSIAMKQYSLRIVGMAGSVLLSSGWLLTIFVKQLWQIVVSVGILQGLGCGIVMTVSLTSFNQYFDKKRMAVIGICKMLIGFGNMLFPIYINYTLVTYGFMGTIMILSATVMHIFFGILLMQPVEWHQNKIPIEDNNSKEAYLEQVETKKFIIEPVSKNGHQLLGMSHHLESDNEDDNHLTIKNDQSRARALSIVSVGQTVIACSEKSDKKQSIWKSLTEILDMGLFKDPIFCNICFGVSLALTSDMIFFSLVPMQMASDKYPQDQIAYSLSMVSGADLVARGLIGLLGNYVHFTSRTLCTIGIIGTFFFRIVYLYVKGFIPIMILVGILGFLRSPITVGAMIIYAEYIPEKFTAAFGLLTLMTGVIGAVLTPAVGILNNYTNSYLITFHVLNSLYVLVIVPWLFEFYITRKKVVTNKK